MSQPQKITLSHTSAINLFLQFVIADGGNPSPSGVLTGANTFSQLDSALGTLDSASLTIEQTARIEGTKLFEGFALEVTCGNQPCSAFAGVSITQGVNLNLGLIDVSTTSQISLG